MTLGTEAPITLSGTEQIPLNAGCPAKCPGEPFQAFRQGNGMTGLTLQEDLFWRYPSPLITLLDELELGEMG